MRHLNIGAAVGALLLMFVGGCGSPRGAVDLLAALDSLDPQVVCNALADIEQQCPASAEAQARMKQLVADARPAVRRKAARVLGAIGAVVEPQTIDTIAHMLSSSDHDEVIDALKALREMPAQRTIPNILPLLLRKDDNVVRDACRTLAALADHSAVVALEVLLVHPSAEVRKDAQIAINRLKAK